MTDGLVVCRAQIPDATRAAFDSGNGTVIPGYDDMVYEVAFPAAHVVFAAAYASPRWNLKDPKEPVPDGGVVQLSTGSILVIGPDDWPRVQRQIREAAAAAVAARLQTVEAV